MFVADLERSKRFYSDGFGWDLAFAGDDSAVYMVGGALINLLAESQAPGLIAPASVAEPNAGQRFMLSIFVEDTLAEIAKLAERGITPINGPIDRHWGMRTACFVDPDGYVWELAQQIDAPDASAQ
jgi:catechol 2,3-dioxygenase-like lactoylglutathione lyase family enzyme